MSAKPIPELDNQVRRVTKISGMILAGFGLAIFLYPRDGMLWGIAIGIMVGIYNSIMLARRIRNLPDLSPEAGKSYMKKGLVFRLGLIMAVLLLVSQRMPFVNLLAVGAGLLVPYYVSINLSLVENIRLCRQSQAFLRKFYGE